MKTNNITRQRRSASIRFPAPIPEAPRRSPTVARAPAATPDEMKAWVQSAKDLPDIRWDKVQAMREAIRNQTLDMDDRLANLADMLPAELMARFCQTGE